MKKMLTIIGLLSIICTAASFPQSAAADCLSHSEYSEKRSELDNKIEEALVAEVFELDLDKRSTIKSGAARLKRERCNLVEENIRCNGGPSPIILPGCTGN